MQVLSDEKHAIKCSFCGTELIYEDDDVYCDTFGMGYITCPVCGKKNEVGEIRITKHNYKYPKHFHHISTYDKGRRIISDETINQWIDKSIEWLDTNPDKPYHFCSCGDTHVVVFNGIEDNLYNVVVSKDFYVLDIEK